VLFDDKCLGETACLYMRSSPPRRSIDGAVSSASYHQHRITLVAFPPFLVCFLFSQLVNYPSVDRQGENMLRASQHVSYSGLASTFCADRSQH
jgi:hypothetical protein